MSDDPYILMSLKEDKVKNLSQAISNDTARAILNLLSTLKDATETEISKKINTPISTVHYNLRNLIKAKLIEVDEFHYSKKGKEVNHYKLANKLIIIAPKESSGLKEKLKKLLPIFLIAGAFSFVLQLMQSTKSKLYGIFGASSDLSFASEKTAQTAANNINPEAAIVSEAAPKVSSYNLPADDTAPTVEGVNDLAESAAENIENIQEAAIPKEEMFNQGREMISYSEPNIALWFFLGALFTLILIIIIEYIRSKKK